MTPPGDADAIDPVTEYYKQGVDRTLIRENLRKSYDERLLALEDLQRFAEELRKAGETLRQREK